MSWVTKLWSRIMGFLGISNCPYIHEINDPEELERFLAAGPRHFFRRND